MNMSWMKKQNITRDVIFWSFELSDDDDEEEEEFEETWRFLPEEDDEEPWLLIAVKVAVDDERPAFDCRADIFANPFLVI